jgi:Ca2+-binding RTX toxin-like protein
VDYISDPTVHFKVVAVDDLQNFITIGEYSTDPSSILSLGEVVYSVDGFRKDSILLVRAHLDRYSPSWHAPTELNGIVYELGAGNLATQTGQNITHTINGVYDTTPPPGAGQLLQAALGSTTVMGGADNDTISGWSGGDYLRGNDGNDSIIGGSGFDDINGNKGNDTIDGGVAGGADWLVGGQGADLITAHLGDGLLYGNLGADTLNGGAGSEIIRGGQDDDVLFGGAGNDFLSGDKGADTITGGRRHLPHVHIRRDRPGDGLQCGAGRLRAAGRGDQLHLRAGGPGCTHPDRQDRWRPDDPGGRLHNHTHFGLDHDRRLSSANRTSAHEKGGPESPARPSRHLGCSGHQL